MLVKMILKFFIGVVDEQLLEAILLKVFKTVDVKNSNKPCIKSELRKAVSRHGLHPPQATESAAAIVELILSTSHEKIIEYMLFAKESRLSIA